VSGTMLHHVVWWSVRTGTASAGFAEPSGTSVSAGRLNKSANKAASGATKLPANCRPRRRSWCEEHMKVRVLTP
jgi:hypothetical protein